MKHVVVETGLQEADIRPPSLMSEFKRLSIIDAGTFFGDPSVLVDVDCPACGSAAKRGAFRKNEFLYNVCEDCGSLFVSPRPNEEALVRYYRESRASHFRSEHFARQTAQARRIHLLRSHAGWLGRIVDEAGLAEPLDYADIETQSCQVFEEMRSLKLFNALYSINPLPGLEGDCEAAGAAISRTPITGLGAATAFAVLENRFSPMDFMALCHDMLADGGILSFTTRTVSGFDLSILWDKTPYIFVPEHLNLLSIEGIVRLIERSGFRMVELSTPGQLDLELTLHAAQHDPSIRLPAFVDYMLKHRDHETRADFQAFLQKNRLSSHARVAVAKSENPKT